MKIYYCFDKGVLQFHCPTRVWRVFYPRKGAKANRVGTIINQDQTRVIFQNYKLKGKPVVHKGAV